MLSALQQVYGDTALKKSAVYSWFSQFKNGQETLEDDQGSGRLLTSRTKEIIEQVRQLIRCDDHRGVGTEVGISHGLIHAILSDDLKMRRVSAMFVLRQLTTDQMECHVTVPGKNIPVITQPP